MAAKKRTTKKKEPATEAASASVILRGRPPSFETPQQLIDEAGEYFDSCAKSFTLPNKAGLALWLHCSKDTLNTYAKERGEDYSVAIKAIYSYIEDAWIQRLSRQHPTGAIFYLKNAFRYVDEIKNTGEQNVTINFTMPTELIEKYETPKLVEATVIEPEALIDPSYAIAPEPATHSEG